MVQGRIAEFQAHLERLAASARAVYAAELPPATAAEARLRVRDAPLARLRIALVPDRGALRAEHSLTAIARDIVLPGWDGALTLRAVQTRGWSGAHKWSDRRLLNDLDERCAPNGALLVDIERGVLETTRANVFVVVDDGILVTPPADGAILPGLMRRLIIELARAMGVAVYERTVDLEEVARAQEVFATGSVRGIEPVKALDGATLAGPGALSSALAKQLAIRWFG